MRIYLKISVSLVASTRRIIRKNEMPILRAVPTKIVKVEKKW
jgi:hypothetical protein